MLPLSRPHELVMGPDSIGRELTSVGHVRRTVRQFLEHEGVADSQDDVLLVLSELVTNSMIHTPDAPEVVVRHQHRPERIDIEVSDGSPLLPVPRIADVGPHGGRGLRIVDHLSAAWGVRPSDGGKTTWASVPIPVSGLRPSMT